MSAAIRGGSLYAEPKVVTDPAECHFYHSMEVPGYGEFEGPWDLRGGEAEYLGGVDVSGKRVLEIGTASGFLCFHMEQAGADVVAFDLSPEQSFDLVPYARSDHSGYTAAMKQHVGMINNAFWLNHRARNSQARAVYGTVYELPSELGAFDIATLGSVLLHLRDPFLALEKTLAHTRETVVITDKSSSLHRIPLRLSDKLARGMFFRPDALTCSPETTWWRLTPQLLQRMVAVLGFEESRVSYHRQLYMGKKTSLFTLVARRTHSLPELV